MTGCAGHNVGVRDAVLIDRLAGGCECSLAVIGGLGRQPGKMQRQIAPCPRTEGGYSAPHILSRKWIVPGMPAEAAKLAFDVLRALAGQSRCGRVALSRWTVTPGAIADARRVIGQR